MKKAALILMGIMLFSIVSLVFFMDYADGKYWIPVLIADVMLIVIAAKWVKKKAAELKEEQGENEPARMTPEYKEYYYSKGLSTGLLIAYIIMPLGFTYALTLPDITVGYYVGFGFVAAMCYYFLWMVISKWLLPAYRNQPAFSIDGQRIDLKNGYTPIMWNEIETILQRGSGVICIKLNNPDHFIDRQPVKKNNAGMKLNRLVNGYHFGINPMIIRDDGTDVFTTIQHHFEQGKDKF